MKLLLKKPSAWVPIVLSLAALVAMLVSIAIAGVPARQPDEGVGAHFFQIWLVLETVLVLIFTAKWLPESPKQTILILILQIITILLPMSIVFFLNL